MAIAAGIPQQDAEVIATAAQFVDDQNFGKWILCASQEGLLGIATAHHPFDAGVRTTLSQAESNDARSVWVPFHFLPGNEGVSFEERMICRKDSAVAAKMLDHYLNPAMMREHRNHALALMGILAHVYADTFSHYGFSGITSDLNEIDAGSMAYSREHSNAILAYIEQKAEAFQSRFASLVRLGHGAALTNPDRPYLTWSFKYSTPFEGSAALEARENSKTFLEACQKLHERFASFSSLYYADGGPAANVTPWGAITQTVEGILKKEASADDRKDAWLEAIADGAFGAVKQCTQYSPDAWLAQIKQFEEDADTQKFVRSHPYRFFVAADYHRTYVLKALLPSCGLLVA
jgi:hypothetical protein